jgi:hypothetical protein
MKIAISSGHGLKIRGARGNPVPPQHDEVDSVRKIVDRVAAIWKTMDVGVAAWHDNVSTTQSANLTAIVNWHNAQTRDYDVSVHLNAFDYHAHGTEVLYKTQGDLADRVSSAIAKAGGFHNRGPKYRSDLKFLNSTHKPAILLETYFCDNTSDCDKADAKFEAICQAIAASISGQPVAAPPPEVGLPPAPPPAETQRTLEQGDQGADVARLQQSLGVPIDGDFGPVTTAQVKAFQAAAGLVVDGIAGPLTWAEVKALDERVLAGNNGVPPDLAVAITKIAEASELFKYEWPDRGLPPPGYIPGMAQAFAVAMGLFFDGASNAQLMARPEMGDVELDALAWLKADFTAAGMNNTHGGLDTLRGLFVLLIGLGMRESSGNYSCGRDMSAANVSASTAEAGLFQTSWNINSASIEIPKLLGEYWSDPNGFLPMFNFGLFPTASDLQVYGSGDGARYQFLAKFSPVFACMTTGIGLRLRRAHWGPVQRREVTITPLADKMLKEVQQLVVDYSPEEA